MGGTTQCAAEISSRRRDTISSRRDLLPAAERIGGPHRPAPVQALELFAQPAGLGRDVGDVGLKLGDPLAKFGESKTWPLVRRALLFRNPVPRKTLIREVTAPRVIAIGDSSCADGPSLIEADLESKPFTTYTTEFDIEAPRPT